MFLTLDLFEQSRKGMYHSERIKGLQDTVM